MEETYGYNWAEAPADIYLPASDCTIGSFLNHTEEIDEKLNLLYC
jgi:hypothetical protein